MLLQGTKEFRVLLFAPDTLKGCRFEKKGNLWCAAAYAEEKPDENDPGAAWSRLLRSLGGKRDSELILSGALEKGMYFTFPSVPLSPREQKGAIAMELPRRLLSVPEEYLLQFREHPGTGGGTVSVGVYLVPENALNFLKTRLTRSGIRADLFFYPLLACSPAEPGLALPELDPEFFYSGESWHPLSGNEEKLRNGMEYWKAEFQKEFTLPDVPDFMEKFAGVLLTACAVVRGERAEMRSLQLLPERLRPVRYRKHLILSAVLFLLLLVNGIWYFLATRGAEYREYKRLNAENSSLKGKAEGLRTRLKRVSKSIKDMYRVLSIENTGDPELIEKIARFSEILPQNVLVNSIRASDSGVECMLQTEDSAFNLPGLVSQLGYWKVGQLQQRQFGNSAAATIIVKLVPKEAGETKK